MNICYHYYTIKTLAVKSGFSEEDAQTIAHYSQMVDDFIFSSRVIINETPPDFFINNGLAKKLGNGNWAFLPCTTGIDVIKSVSHKYQRHTLAPFHFIPPVKISEIERKDNFTRLDYRCVRAGAKDGLIIDEILRSAAEKTKEEKNKKNLINLGMALHTYADTYAHCNYSGFHGYENESVIKKAFNKFTRSDGVSEAEILFYKELPSIGHGNVGSVPDICCCDIAYAMKSSEDSGLDYPVKRDNTESFAQCSRSILDVLCMINGRSLFNDDEWNELQTLIAQAQYVKKEKDKYLKESWSKAFPDINYHYDKNSDFSIKLNIEKSKDLLMSDLDFNIEESVLCDAFSPEGDNARNCCNVYLEEANQDFFDYNELAYRRIKYVTSEYASRGTFENFSDACQCYYKHRKGDDLNE